MARNKYKRKKHSQKESDSRPRESRPPAKGKNPSPGRLALLLIFLLGTLLYAQTVSFDYAYDDKLVITSNDFTKQGIAGIPKILSTGFLVGFFGEQRNLLTGGRYRPLSLVTYALEWQFFGHNPGISHLINAVLYGLTGVLLLLVFTRILAVREGSVGVLASVPMVATLLWILHPLHIEVVANIKGRDELLSFLGALGTLLLFLRYLDRGRLRDLLAGVLVFVLALLAKESAFTFLAVIPLTAYFFSRHRPVKILKAMVPLGIGAALWLGMRHLVIGSAQLSPPPELMNDPFVYASGSERLATVFYTMGIYLKLLVFPHPLTNDYYPLQIPIVGWNDVRSMGSLLIYLGFGVLAVLGFRKKSVIAYSILVFLITFFPFCNLLFSIGTFMNERFMYAPSVGFCIAAAYAIERLRRGRPRSMQTAVGVLTLLVLVGFAGKTLTRTPAWKDDFTLFSTDVKTSSRSAKANMSAGFAYFQKALPLSTIEEKRPLIDTATGYLRTAVELHPSYLQAMDLTGAAYAQIEDYQSAVDAYERCLSVGGRRSAEVVRCWSSMERMGDICGSGGYPELAVRAYQIMLQYEETNPVIQAKLGRVYGKEFGNSQLALKHLERANELDPNNVETLRDLGVAHGVHGDTESAVAVWLRALAIAPNDKSLLQNLSAGYRTLGEAAEAEAYQRRAAAQGN